MFRLTLMEYLDFAISRLKTILIDSALAKDREQGADESLLHIYIYI